MADFRSYLGSLPPELTNALREETTASDGLGAGTLDGLKLSYVGATSVSIAPGNCRAASNAADISVPAPIVVNTSVSGVGGLDVGALGDDADGWYAVYVIAGDAGVGGICSLSFSAPTLPTGYTEYRRVGAFRGDGVSSILAFHCTGSGRARTFWHDDPSAFAFTGPAGNDDSFTDIDLSEIMPPTATVALIDMRLTPSSVNNSVELRRNGSAGVHASLSGVVPAAVHTVSNVRIPVDENQIIEYRVSAGTDAFDMDPVGYEDEL